MAEMTKKKIVKILSIITSISLLIVVPYLIMNREHVELDSIIRTDYGYDYIELSEGVTHYQLTGPADAPVIVLVHGFSVPLHDWDYQVSFLVDAGYRVLRYDHFGRGYSDRPDRDYNRELYVRQLYELTEALGIQKSFHLVCHSYGAGVGAEFTGAYPEKVNKIVLLTPILHASEGNSAIPLAKIPLFGPWFMRVAGIPIIEKRGLGLFSETFQDDIEKGRYSAEFSDQFRYKGTSRAITSLFRTGAFDDYTETYNIIRNTNREVMIVYGGEDNSISDEHYSLIKGIFEESRIEFFPEGTHSLNLQQPDRFNQILLDFIQ